MSFLEYDRWPRLPVMWVAMGIALVSTTGRSDSPNSADVEFFEKQVRPILSQHCYECHSEKKTKGNLRLDTSGGWLKGGDTGPAIVPGHPDDSLLIAALRHDGGDVAMPPNGKLPSEIIKVLEEWVARGAPAPATDINPLPREHNVEKGRSHWSYQPVVQPNLPTIEDHNSADGRIDLFVLAGLRRAGIAESPATDRYTLIRRLSFDLVGLPPDPDEIESFVHDASPTAYHRLVDRLLASASFGERWGRHWLDVVRFAESLTLRGFVFPEAWRYRDYVISQFNDDRPLDRFLREQLAGDLMPIDSTEERHRRLVATTFWTLGNTNLEEQDKKQLDMDVVDEQIDVMGKAMLGQTLGCARCHDHKFDPITARDYYALAGILRNTRMLEHANVSAWTEVNLPLPPTAEGHFQQLEARAKELTESMAQTKKQIAAMKLASKSKTGQGSNGAIDVAALPGIVVDNVQAKKVGEWTESASVKPHVGPGYLHDAAAGKGDKTITFAPTLPRDGQYEVRLAYTPGANRAESVPITVFSADGEKTILVNMKQIPPIDGLFLSLGEYRFESAGQSFVLIANEGTKGHVIADAVQFLPRDQVSSPERTKSSGPANDKSAEIESLEQRMGLQLISLKVVEASLQTRPRVMTIVERPEINDCPVHLRGSVHTLGETVPRGFPQMLTPLHESPLPSNESGRRELAAWVTATENPLTSRVYVNRVWHWLFGEGIVRTVDNFGTTGEPPSHPELLDDLSLRFVDEDWSTKFLVRSIVESNTYRQDSSGTTGEAIDPENRLLWRANRRRLDAEALRDSMLQISGELQREMGGTTILPNTKADYGYVDTLVRRSVYVPVFRNALPELFQVFDFPDPSLVVGSRSVSTVAPQALFLMNHPFVQERAVVAAKRLLSERIPQAESIDDEDRIKRAFLLGMGRAPFPEEVKLAHEVLAKGSGSLDDKTHAWANLFQLLFLSLDFRYQH